MDDMDRVLTGQCIHGFGSQAKCITCQYTLRLAGLLRGLIGALLEPRKN